MCAVLNGVAVVVAVGLSGCATSRAGTDASRLTIEAVGSAFLEEDLTGFQIAPAQPHWDQLVEATGKGLAAPQAVSEGHRQLTALEAAKYRALAELAEKIRGARVTRTSSVRDMAFAGEEVAIEMSAIIEGAHIIQESYDKEMGIAEVTLRIGLDADGNMMSQSFAGRFSPSSHSERRARAEEAARVRAAAALRERVGRVRIEERVEVRNLVLIHQHARQHVEGMLQHVMFDPPQWIDEKQCRVVARLLISQKDLDQLAEMTGR